MVSFPGIRIGDSLFDISDSQLVNNIYIGDIFGNLKKGGNDNLFRRILVIFSAKEASSKTTNMRRPPLRELSKNYHSSSRAGAHISRGQ
jgi:hypothetical protein